MNAIPSPSLSSGEAEDHSNEKGISRRGLLGFSLGLSLNLSACSPSESAIKKDSPFLLLQSNSVIVQHLKDTTKSNLVSFYFMQSADRNHNWEETFPSTQAGNSGKSCTEKSGDDLYTVTIASESVTFSNANSVNPKRSFSYTYNLNTFTLTSKYDSSLGKLDIDLGEISEVFR